VLLRRPLVWSTRNLGTKCCIRLGIGFGNFIKSLDCDGDKLIIIRGYGSRHASLDTNTIFILNMVVRPHPEMHTLQGLHICITISQGTGLTADPISRL